MSTIISLEDLNTYSGDTDIEPALGQMVVDAVNEYVESTTGRCWGELATATDEVHDYAPVVFLTHQDVHEVTEVKRGRGNGSQTTLQSSGYFVNPYGRLVLSEGRSSFNLTRDYITVTYTYGVTATPADLQLASLALASDFYSFAENGGSDVTEAEVGTYRLKVESGQGSSTGRTSFNVINRYRTRRV